MGALFSGLMSVASPYLLYIKIAAVLAIALLIGGLYWYGHHEAARVETLNQQIGVAQKTIADDKVTLSLYVQANAKYAAALSKYQQDAQNQAAAAASANAQKDAINAELKDLEARLRADPSGSAVRLNADNDRIVCMLNRATGAGDNCAATSPDAPATSAPRTP
jgi:hypothetical protein